MTFRWIKIAIFIAAVGPAAVQAQRSIDVTGVNHETRIGPAMLCDNQFVAGSGKSGKLETTLLSIDRPSYALGDLVTFEVRFRNTGKRSLRIPVEACSTPAADAHHATLLNSTEACINLAYSGDQIKSDWLTGSCLCGHAKRSGTLEILEPGDSLIVRDKAVILVTDPALYNDSLTQETPLILQVRAEVELTEQRLSPKDPKNSAEGCVIRMPMKYVNSGTMRFELLSKKADSNP